jgi:hypothetical protein
MQIMTYCEIDRTGDYDSPSTDDAGEPPCGRDLSKDDVGRDFEENITFVNYMKRRVIKRSVRDEEET